MGIDRLDLWRILGSSARLWAAPDHHVLMPDSWLAFSGEANVNYNVACCRAPSTAILTEQCLQPVLELGKPAIIMLAGAGLASAQKLADAHWVTVGALPLMALHKSSARLTVETGSSAETGGRALEKQELPLARQLLAATYGLDDASAAAAAPDRAVENADTAVWGLYDEGRLVSCATTVVEDGWVVLWSMATRPESQGRGYGRRLLRTALSVAFENGASGALLHSSVAGEKLYRSLGYEVVEYWQLWSRPRWVIGYA
jgi:GNAT superfamily N-acetyltransferase